MQKLSNLSIGAWRFFACTCVIFALSCSHFQSPEYSGGAEYSLQGEFSSPEEIYNSDAMKGAERPRIQRGPFHLQWPVKKLTITRGFSHEGRKTHAGLDIRGRRNDSILAAHDGTVIYAGSGFRGYGKMIILEYDSSWATLYGHLNKFKVKTGQQVKAGQVIGLMGRTGRATGVHLHFELMRDKVPVDPKPMLFDAATFAGR
ncbi:MAG: M23 family metallopeptidase [Bdellovibrionales bacterium]|nr:M23 family metallopeptidase [Bdellovibrionales bacterium]